jgi:adenine-specific DNA-methyltransferase
MNDYAPAGFQYPSTRYSGSKRRFLGWIWEKISDIPFESALDVFGGTGSVSLLLKRHGKRVHYNDLLDFNQVIGRAFIENDATRVTDQDIERVLEFRQADYPNFIQREFRGRFFLPKENRWLDKVVTNISSVHDRYKRSILLAALFQACLAKRPFNLFHRANLYIRTAAVERTFGNKTTWERPFPELLRRYVAEYNGAIFSNGKTNRVVGGFDAISAPNGVDLVYLDPPYFSASPPRGTNYLHFYHFLEGMADYNHWADRIDRSNKKTKRLSDSEADLRFSRKSSVVTSLESLLDRFQDNIIVLSYQSDGIPSADDTMSMLRKYKRRVTVFEHPHSYVLSRAQRSELLFVAK